jgi:tetratricopeptide (TPR) repeat protein
VNNYSDLLQKVVYQYRNGAQNEAVGSLSQVIQDMAKTMPPADATEHHQLYELLYESSSEVITLLRWDRRYQEAIELEKSIINILPDYEDALRVNLATLLIEAGLDEEGFDELYQVESKNKDNIWALMTIGTNYLWVQDYEKAEQYLLQASALESVSPAERAMAYKNLFNLYKILKRFDEAENTWKIACDLDEQYQDTIAEVIRMFLLGYRYQRAKQYVEKDTCTIRKIYYRQLIEFKEFSLMPKDAWKWIFEFEPEHIDQGIEEYCEACLRYVYPKRALAVLNPIVEEKRYTSRQILLAGLAWAQARMPARAKWALEIALRMEDLERPRRSRPGKDEFRILDIESRILYGEIIVDADMRKEVDPFFIPIMIQQTR